MSTRITRRKGSFAEAEKESTAECAVVTEKPVAPKAIEKVPITLVVDNSNEKINIMHYLAMFIWLGWPSIYLTLMLTFPLLFLYARPVLMVIVIVLTTSAIYPIDIRKQPKVCLAHGFSCIHCIPLHMCAVYLFPAAVGNGLRGFTDEVSEPGPETAVRCINAHLTTHHCCPGTPRRTSSCAFTARTVTLC
jgi:hypothetical protein